MNNGNGEVERMHDKMVIFIYMHTTLYAYYILSNQYNYQMKQLIGFRFGNLDLFF